MVCWLPLRPRDEVSLAATSSTGEALDDGGGSGLLSQPRPPNVPLLTALWFLLDGIWGVLTGSWGVLEYSTIDYQSHHFFAGYQYKAL